MNNRYAAGLQLIIVSAIWASTFVFIKEIVNELSIFLIVSLRFFIASFLMAIFLLCARKNPFKKSILKKGGLLGVLLFIIFSVQALALRHTNPSNAAFINNLFVIFIPAIAYFVFGNKVSCRTFILCLVSFLGIALITSVDSSINFGDIIMLFAAVAVALHVVLVGKYAKAEEMLQILFVQFLTIFGLSTISFLLIDASPIVPGLRHLSVIFYLALFATLLGFFLQMKAQKVISPAIAGTIFALQPFFTTILSIIIIGEHLTLTKVLGGSLMIISTALAGR